MVNATGVRSRRAAVLLLFGVAFILIGLSYLGTQTQITANPTAAQSYRAHLRLMPLDVWAWMFMVCGGVGVGSALTRWRTAGFAALECISSWWGLEFIASYATTGYRRAITAALIWLVLAGVLAIIAGWRDPPVRFKGAGPHLEEA